MMLQSKAKHLFVHVIFANKKAFVTSVTKALYKFYDYSYTSTIFIFGTSKCIINQPNK
jgi:hypothetical protein